MTKESALQYAYGILNNELEYIRNQQGFCEKDQTRFDRLEAKAETLIKMINRLDQY
jgi:hypothetical protein